MTMKKEEIEENYILHFNPFQPGVAYLYPLKTSGNL